MIEQIQNSKKSDKYFNLLSSGINHLWQNSEGLGIDKFVITTLEILMLLEREEHLKQFSNDNESLSLKKDKGNGTYPRDFRSLSKSNLTINIPRTRSGKFKPLVIEILKQNQGTSEKLKIEIF